MSRSKKDQKHNNYTEMEPDQILSKYSLTRENAAAYIDTITRKNQSQTAEEIGVSRDTISRYKREFSEMTDEERAQVIASLIQEKFLEEAAAHQQ